ncbi:MULTISPECIES: DUF4254 domain-containing protein [unclassified Nocardia]|uniref:DUF4254 domain-containing protein n=1 Tax=unclassified Nocardia TaxID=2637762 RepID=UPI00278C3F5C|nr:MULTISPECIES: DUF4254 domain-containing protein [unclassified Nocardia]
MKPFPIKREMLAACRGDASDTHPLLPIARELSEIHQRLLTVDDDTRAAIDRRRAELIHVIDAWVALELPPALGCARLHTETMGAVIDRLAEFSACALEALSVGGDSFIAWERLAELAVGYEDLTAEVSSGRRRLPCAPREVAPYRVARR